MRRLVFISVASTLPSVLGCQEAIIHRTDQQVYDLIKNRQRAALNMTTDVNIGPETGDVPRPDRMYSFTPRPIDSGIPEEFQKPASPEVEPPAPSPTDPAPAIGQAAPIEPVEPAVPAPTAEITEKVAGPTMSASIFPDDVADRVVTFGLPEALAYADAEGNDLQNAKEALYLEALDLTLERHLWTPQFVSNVLAEYANYGQVRDFDQAMRAVSDFAVAQRLPYGGDITARVINTLMRDLGANTTSGETGDFILEANLPLLRGAGPAAYESRYSAEREMIYAVRTYERFRRVTLVRVAGDYFELQQLRSAIGNTHKAYVSRYNDWIKADFIHRMGQSKDIFEAPRAKSNFREAEAALVSAKQQYASALDRYKIVIGMPMDTPLDVLDQDKDEAAVALEELLSDVSVEAAESAALRYRLDLLNSADQADDADRRVLVRKNAILPDLNVRGSATVVTDPDHLNSTSYNTERTTWRGFVELEMTDRKAERNAYRASLIAARRAARDYEQAGDTVRAEVRRTMRSLDEQERLMTIQALNVEENEFRLAAARAQFDLGRSTNQDVVDAEDDLLTARNDYADAVASYRIAILAFRLATDTLRVTEDGQWQQPEAPWLPPPTPVPGP